MARPTFDSAFELILAADNPVARVVALKDLVAVVRPRRRESFLGSTHRLRDLSAWLLADAQRRAAVRALVRGLLAEHRAVDLFTDVGVLASEGFFTQLGHRLAQKLLPEEVDPTSLKDALGVVFRPEDDRWLSAVPDEVWLELLSALELDEERDERQDDKIERQLLDALLVLSHRIAALGLEPVLSRNYPHTGESERAFLEQAAEMRRYLEAHASARTSGEPPALDDAHLLVLLAQCQDVLDRVRRQAARTGASIAQTYRMVRLEQLLARAERLLDFLRERPRDEVYLGGVGMLREIVRGESRKNSVTELVQENVGLLALRVTSNAGKTGEKYITSSRQEYRALFYSAAGAGLFIALMALIKIGMYGADHSPFAKAFFNGLNYGLGFVLIYVLHLTVATKQPAMTAAYIAQALETPGGPKARVLALTDLIVRTARSQFIAVVGNVAVTFTVAVAILLAFRWAFGGSPISDDKARGLLADVHPLSSPAIVHAAIAGFCLFLSGLISGFGDNLSAHARLPGRIREHPTLKRVLGVRVSSAIADYFDKRFGGVLGNFTFGVMLGSMGPIGLVLGLPLDIRHIAFSTANVAYGFAALDFALAPAAIVIAFTGLGAIGMTNLVVSFTLALFLAMPAQGVRFREAAPLLVNLGKRFLTTPQQFLWPPKEAPASASTSSASLTRDDASSAAEVPRG